MTALLVRRWRKLCTDPLAYFADATNPVVRVIGLLFCAIWYCAHQPPRHRIEDTSVITGWVTLEPGESETEIRFLDADDRPLTAPVGLRQIASGQPIRIPEGTRTITGYAGPITTPLHPRSTAYVLLTLLRHRKMPLDAALGVIRPVSMASINSLTPSAGQRLLLPRMDAKPIDGNSARSVSVIIPSRDRADLLSPCLATLYQKTRQPPFETIVVDNGSTDPATHELYSDATARWPIRIVDGSGPFNFSTLCNQGVEEASGDLIVLLNNDVEIIEDGWLDAMNGLFSDPDIGVVGPELVYPDGRIQHAGVAVADGRVAYHAYRGIPAGSPDRPVALVEDQIVDAVTGACLVTPRRLYLNLGGLDQDNLAVCYNDVDYCLRVENAGYAVVWTPRARLVHHESMSRGGDRGRGRRAQFEMERSYMSARWKTRLRTGPRGLQASLPHVEAHL